MWLSGHLGRVLGEKMLGIFEGFRVRKKCLEGLKNLGVLEGFWVKKRIWEGEGTYVITKYMKAILF